jgi:hypothetical protein
VTDREIVSGQFTIFSEREGKPYKHEVKALQLLWNKFPHWNASNTIHIDDLVRILPYHTPRLVPPLRR